MHKWKHIMEFTNKHYTINIKTDYQNNNLISDTKTSKQKPTLVNTNK